MLSVVSLLTIVLLSIIITRIATIALTHTGLSRQAARFQARSALTGAGFTTRESESVVNHPVRRRIILGLMLLGNAGIVTAVSSLILTFVDSSSPTALPIKIALLVAGLVALWGLAMSSWVDRRLSWLIDKALSRYTHLDVRDYASLMHLAGEYRLAELQVESQDWLANKSFSELELREEGVVALGIRRGDGSYLGAPEGETQVFPGDTLILYGRVSALERLDERRSGWTGDVEHEEAVAEQERVAEKEAEADARKHQELSASGKTDGPSQTS